MSFLTCELCHGHGYDGASRRSFRKLVVDIVRGKDKRCIACALKAPSLHDAMLFMHTFASFFPRDRVMPKPSVAISKKSRDCNHIPSVINRLLNFFSPRIVASQEILPNFQKFRILAHEKSHSYEQTEDGREECRACNPDGETLREHGRDEMSEKLNAKVGGQPEIEITLRQAEELVKFFGGHDCKVTVMQRPAAWHDMPDGLYAYCTEYPEEGAHYIGATEVDDDLATNGQPAPAPAHSDDLAVDRFAAAMKAKMAASRAKGRSGWDDPEQCPAARLQTMLLEHLCKGDTVDVGNFAMMLFNRNAPVTAWSAAPPEGWKLVPISATDEIVCAVEREIDAQLEASGMSVIQMQRQDGIEVWNAALVAAPEAPAAVPPLQISPSSDAGAVRPPLEWERKQAEHGYIIGAFDYERHPIGSREWTLYWAGWLARSTAAAPAPASAEGGA